MTIRYQDPVQQACNDAAEQYDYVVRKPESDPPAIEVINGGKVIFNGLDVGKRLRWLLYANITSLLIGATALVLVLVR